MSDTRDLQAIARRIVEEHGFEAAVPAAVEHEVAALRPTQATGPDVRDLRTLLWSSIDNPESRDLDQVEVAERLAGDAIRVRIGIADVGHLVAKGSAIDAHALHNTTSVYTGAAIFPMLPERLSTDLTSLLEGVERLAVVVDLTVVPTGDVTAVEVYRALVVNHAKLAYEDVAGWLAGSTASDGPVGKATARLPGLADQLRLQNDAASRLREQRHRRGALDLETIEANPVTVDGRVVDLALVRKSRARDLIEDFMIAANVAMAERLEHSGIPSIRRVVHAPERWPRIVEIAARYGTTLPAKADSLALALFLRARRAADPQHFADLSLSIVKLIGAGEYTVERPWVTGDGVEDGEGHFGLAVDDYSHATAPNRRYADLVMQRLLVAMVAGAAAPYTAEELDGIAARCTQMEDEARRVERAMRKAVAATLLAGRIGETFDAIVTGVSSKGVFARLLHPPAEGRIMRGTHGLDVGDRVRVRLTHTDREKGWIDFEVL
jgi:VacB/RNase II family 3'-5' exoribonuclease